MLNETAVTSPHWKKNIHTTIHTTSLPIPSSFPRWLTGSLGRLYLALDSPGGGGGGLLHPRHVEGLRVRGARGEGTRQTLLSFKLLSANARGQFLDFLLAHQRNDLVEDLEVRPVRVCGGVAPLDVLKWRERVICSQKLKKELYELNQYRQETTENMKFQPEWSLGL